MRLTQAALLLVSAWAINVLAAPAERDATEAAGSERVPKLPASTPSSPPAPGDGPGVVEAIPPEAPSSVPAALNNPKPEPEEGGDSAAGNNRFASGTERDEGGPANRDQCRTARQFRSDACANVRGFCSVPENRGRDYCRDIFISISADERRNRDRNGYGSRGGGGGRPSRAGPANQDRCRTPREFWGDSCANVRAFCNAPENRGSDYCESIYVSLGTFDNNNNNNNDPENRYGGGPAANQDRCRDPRAFYSSACDDVREFCGRPENRGRAYCESIYSSLGRGGRDSPSSNNGNGGRCPMVDDYGNCVQW